MTNFILVDSANNPGCAYLYDPAQPGAVAFAAIKRYPDGSLSITVVTEVEVYRDGTKLVEKA